MKAYFTKMFNYDRFENESILKTIIQAKNSGSASKLMAHLLAAQQIWLSRCKGLTLTDFALWPDRSTNELQDMIENNSTGWLEYLGDLSPQDFEKEIAYHDTKGNLHQNKLVDILAHVINHGTHHRAQAGQELKHAGDVQLPTTDYIFYVRQL